MIILRLMMLGQAEKFWDPCTKSILFRRRSLSVFQSVKESYLEC